ncbi:MAG TPA: sigma-70 family RNA polymerase sigma factor, partial [Herpetosiphonaceae bacterium]
MHNQTAQDRRPARAEQERSVRDGILMDRIAGGDEAALAELYGCYAGPAFSLAYRVLGDASAAEEALQDTFMRLWAARSRYDRERGTVATWLLTIAHRRAIDGLRQRRRHAQALSGEEPAARELIDRAPLPEERSLLSEQAAAVRAALGRLPAGERQALELAFFQGLTQREIALALSEPEGTVKARMRRGMQRLKLLLERPAPESASEKPVPALRLA